MKMKYRLVGKSVATALIALCAIPLSAQTPNPDRDHDTWPMIPYTVSLQRQADPITLIMNVDPEDQSAAMQFHASLSNTPTLHAGGTVHFVRVAPEDAETVMGYYLTNGVFKYVHESQPALPLAAPGLPSDPYFQWNPSDPLIPFFNKNNGAYGTYYVRADQWYYNQYAGADSTIYNAYNILLGGYTEPGAPRTDVHAVEAWLQFTNDVSSVLVAIMDSGIASHEDLLGNIWTNTDAIYYPGITDTSGGVRVSTGLEIIPGLFDEQGHGTMCAGIAGAVGDNGIGITGLGWKSSIIQLGAPRYSEAEYIILIDYAIFRGVKVINCSWKIGPAPGLEQAMKNAGEQHGIIFTVAADNSATDHDVNGLRPLAWGLPNVIGVTYTDHNGVLDPFAGWGSTNVFIAAPGRRIVSTLSLNWTNVEPAGVPVVTNGYAYFTGTSCATPMITMAIAYIKTVYPDSTLDDIKLRLYMGVDRDPSLVGKTVTGGRLNLYKTLAWTEPTWDWNPANQSLDLTVSPIGTYWIESSTNMVDWTTITNLSTTVASMPIDLAEPQRFFRWKASNE